MKLKVGLVGLGRIGAELESSDSLREKPCTHLGAWEKCDLVDVVAVCDLDLKKLSKYSKYHTYEHYKEMLEEEKLDIVSIATPTSVHGGMAMIASSRYHVKGIFLEKPIATCVRDAQMIVDSCKKHESFLAVNYTRRWDSFWKNIKKRIELGHIGKLVNIIAHYPNPMMRSGSHMLDLINWFVDSRPFRVYGKIYKDNWLTRKYPDSNDYSGVAYIEYENDVYVLFAGAGERDHLLFELDLFGTKGRIRAFNNGRDYEMYKSNDSIWYKGMKELDSYLGVYPHKKHTPILSAVYNLALSVKEHIRVPDFSEEVLACTGTDAIKSLELVSAIHLSSRSGKEVFFHRDMNEINEYKIITY